MARAKVRRGRPERGKGTWLFQGGHFYPLIACLALLGLGFASYLTYLHYSHAYTALCEIGSGCDIVRESQYATLLGVPVGLIGVMGYIAIMAVALAPLEERLKKMLLVAMALVGFVFSVYLTYLELFVIEAICPYCLVSAAIMTVIFLLLLLRRPVVPGVSAPRLVLWGVVLSVFVVLGAVFLHHAPVSQAMPGAEFSQTQPLESSPRGSHEAVSYEQLQLALAQHLRAIGTRVYGAFWCPACVEQKKLFSDAFSYVDYVECDPQGEDARAELCQAKDIRYLPTWEIKGQLHVGSKTLEELARLSGYEGPWPEG